MASSFSLKRLIISGTGTGGGVGFGSAGIVTGGGAFAGGGSGPGRVCAVAGYAAKLAIAVVSATVWRKRFNRIVIGCRNSYSRSLRWPAASRRSLHNISYNIADILRIARGIICPSVCGEFQKNSRGI